MSERIARVLYVLLTIGLVASERPARAIDIEGVQPGALDQPRISALLRLAPDGDPLSFEGVYNIEAFYDTGASGLLLSESTASLLGVPRLQYPAGSGQYAVFEDVGVAGSDQFHVSEPLYLSLAPYHPAVESPSQYTRHFGPVRTQIGPVGVVDPNPLLENLDILGGPAMAGKVVVMDPKPVNTFWDTMRTYAYEPGTPANPPAPELGPGIPATSRHVALSYASFERFTRTTPPGASAPTMAGNPFIGPNPLSAIDPAVPPGPNPPVKVTYNGQAVTGSWLLDTGGSTSIISTAQAAALGVTYEPGTLGTDSPVLQGTPLEGQFTLSIGGIGGTAKLAGFFLESLLLRTEEGNAADDNDPNHIRFLSAPVLVGDITLSDPVTNQTLTLDGIFGMNYLVASAFVSTEGESSFPTIGNLTPGRFDWIVFDQPAGRLGLEAATSTVITAGAQYWYGSELSAAPWSTTDDCFYNETGRLYSDGDQVVFADAIQSIFGSIPVASRVVHIPEPVAPGSVIVDTAESFTFRGAAIRGYTGLTKRGNGVLRLENSNTYSGPTDILAGTIQLAAPQDVGPVYVASGASLVMETSQRLAALNVLGGAASFTLGTGKTLRVKDVLIQNGGVLDLRDAQLELESDLHVTVASAADRLAVNTSIWEDPGNHATLIKSGPGELALGAVNSYSGGTVVLEGTLLAGQAGALPAGRSLTIDAGGTVVLKSGLAAQGFPDTTIASVPVDRTSVPEPGALVLLTVASMGLASLWLRHARGWRTR